MRWTECDDSCTFAILGFSEVLWRCAVARFREARALIGLVSAEAPLGMHLVPTLLYTARLLEARDLWDMLVGGTLVTQP